MCKAYNLTPDYVLYRMSYANVLLYSAVLPSYNGKDKTEKTDEKVINADDPANRDEYLKVLHGD